MLDYLYYKLYQAVLKGSLRDMPEIVAPIYLGGLLGVNISVISAFLAKLDIIPFLFSNVQQGGYPIIILIVFFLLYFRKNKREAVLRKYSEETDEQRRRGTLIVSLYVGISFLLIFAVAFFKPGYLPK